MKRIPCSALILLMMLLSFTSQASEQKQRAAEQEAGKWLALVDGGQYQESWNRAASLFKQQVSPEQWRQAVTAARDPFGIMISRQLMTSNYTTALPGAPDGEYVVLQFKTVFKNKQQAIETVTPMLDNGNWRVSGYYVR